MKRIFSTIQLFYYLFKISKNPQDTHAALRIAEVLLSLGLIQQESEHLKSLPGGAELFAQRRLMQKIDLQELKKLPEGTLGRVYADRMLRENLNPEFYNQLDIKNDEIYGMMRLRQTHDIWHTITGFDTSVAGELGLQAFMHIQTRSPLAPFLIGGGIIREALLNPSVVREIIEQVVTGWRMGHKAESLFLGEWDQCWGESLSGLRERFGVEVVREP